MTTYLLLILSKESPYKMVTSRTFRCTGINDRTLIIPVLSKALMLKCLEQIWLVMFLLSCIVYVTVNAITLGLYEGLKGTCKSRSEMIDNI